MNLHSATVDSSASQRTVDGSVNDDSLCSSCVENLARLRLGIGGYRCKHLYRFFKQAKPANAIENAFAFFHPQAPTGASFENLSVCGRQCPAHRQRVANHQRTSLGVPKSLSRFWFSRTSTLGGYFRQGFPLVAFVELRE